MKHRAAISIEASIVVPFIFLVMLLVYSFMSYLYMDYQVGRAATEAALDLSYDSYLLYHYDMAELLAHHSYQRQSLKAEDLVLLEEKVGKFSQEPPSIDQANLGKMISDFKEIADMSQAIIGKIEKLPDEAKGIGKAEATTFVSRLGFNYYLKNKMTKSLDHLSSFQPEELRIKNGHYFYDFKASSLDVSYIYRFPFRFPFMKEAEIIKPIYIESYIGNIVRYKGEKYKAKKSEDEKEEIVYKTEQGQVYHTDGHCFVIYAEPKAVNRDALPSQAGACKICQKKGGVFGNYVFKTDKSHVYHASLSCTAINHQVIELKLSEAQALSLVQCKHCQKKMAGK